MTVADPHGAVMDTLRSAYSSWMQVPEYADPIRVRWYRVPVEPGSYPLTEYSSSNWDADGISYPGLGELGWRRAMWADWANGQPPPWPMNHPLAVARMHATGVVRRGRRVGGMASASGSAGGAVARARRAVSLDVAAALSASTRSLGRRVGGSAVTSSLAAGLSSGSRVVLGSVLARSSASAVVVRRRATTGLATAKGTASAAVVRKRTVSGSATAKGMTSSTTNKEVSPGCTHATHTPYQVKVVIAGVTNSGCTDCANLNATWTLTWVSACVWRSGTFTLCGAAGQTLNFQWLSGTTWQLQTSGSQGVWQVNLGATWDGRSALTLTRTLQGGCAMPLTLTLTPV